MIAEKNTIVDKFGFLNYSDTISDELFLIKPLEDFNTIIQKSKDFINKDGFIYPPLVCEKKIDITTGNVINNIPRTERPAVLIKTSPTHEIILYDTIYTDSPREWDLFFMINIIGFLFGVRLQLENWWLDSKIPTKQQCESYFRPNTLLRFLKDSYVFWRNLDEDTKGRIINILTVYNKIKTYENDYEKFTFSYMVFDGLYRLARNLDLIPECKNHSKRIDLMISTFDMKDNKEYTEKIYKARNDLFHEAIWANKSFGPNKKKYRHSLLDIYLYKINYRLILAILGFKSDFINSSWWTHGTCVLEFNDL